MTKPEFEKWINEEVSLDERNDELAKFHWTEDDRAAALSGAAFLDVALREALRTRMWLPGGDFGTVFKGEAAPLGTLSAKIKMAYAVRVVGPTSRADLDIIRKVRNYFAHTHRFITFETDQIADLCQGLSGKIWPQGIRRPYYPPDGRSQPKHRFIQSVFGLYIALDQQKDHMRSQSSRDGDLYPVREWWTERYPCPLP